MEPPIAARTPASRAVNLRAGVYIELASIGWMVVEAVIALGAGITTHSVSLETFGIDSGIELVAAWALLRRLRFELRQHSTATGEDAERVEGAEHRASRIVGWALYALAAYVVLDVSWSLLTRNRPQASAAGIALALAACFIMPALVAAKRHIAGRIGSDALHADAACGVVCAYMAAALLVGLALNALLGWWWADSVAATALLWFIIREGREALERAAGRDDCACE